MQETTDTTEMLIVPDLSEAREDVGPGTYQVRVVGHKTGKWDSKQENGKPTYWINWTLETFNEENPKNNGRKIFHRTPINGPGAFKFAAFFKACTGQAYVATQDGFNPSMIYTSEVEVVYGPQKDRPEYSEVKTVKSLTRA